MSWSTFPPSRSIPLGNYRSQVPYPVNGMGLWESFCSKPGPDQTQPGVVTPIGLRYRRMYRHQWVASQPTALRLVVKQADRVSSQCCQHLKPLDNFVEGTFTRASGGPVTGHECQTIVIGWHSPARGHVYERCVAISTARRSIYRSP